MSDSQGRRKHESLKSALDDGNCLLQPIDMCADDWPQWRGPNRDAVWRESGIFDAIPVSGLQVGWRARIGAGYSGPVVHKDASSSPIISLIRRSNVLCVSRK